MKNTIIISTKNKDEFYYTVLVNLNPQEDFDFCGGTDLMTIDNIKIKKTFDSLEAEKYAKNIKILENIKITVGLLDLIESLPNEQRKELIKYLIDDMM
jgi:beta-phosphoglucomutase-like phosphatase (HAD superfamily)